MYLVFGWRVSRVPPAPFPFPVPSVPPGPRSRFGARRDPGPARAAPMDGKLQPLKVALLGCGVVGQRGRPPADEQADDLAARVGRPLELAGIAVRRPGRARGDLPSTPDCSPTTPSRWLLARTSTSWSRSSAASSRPGPLSSPPSRRARRSSRRTRRCSPRTAPTLYAAAEKHGVDLYYEAAVAGAIPLLRPLRESLAGDRVRRVLGIVNGTTNYILTRMTESGASFADALEEAQALGYAEADPTADVEGFDAAAKAAILASLAFHTRVTAADVHREGITEVTAADVASAAGDGLRRQAARDRRARRSVGQRPGPPGDDPAQPPARRRPRGVQRGLRRGRGGRLADVLRAGAGGAPTASAVLGDVVAVARNKVSGGRGPGESAYADLPVRPMGETLTRYHVSLDVADRAGVLAQVATAFAEHEVSIESVRQAMHGADDAGWWS